MATKSVTLTDSFSLITSKAAYIDLKGMGIRCEYHTTPNADPEPVDADATIIADVGFAYPGGDNLYMRVKNPENSGFKITVDEVA